MTDLIIDNSLYEAGKDFLGKKRKKFIIPILAILVGVAITIVVEIFMSGHIYSNTGRMLGYMISITGLSLFVVNIKNKYVPYYLETGKKLWRYEYTFNQNQRDCIIEYINKGNIQSLEDLPKGKSAPIKVIVYRTQEEDLMLVQALESTHSSYKPITDIKIIQNK